MKRILITGGTVFVSRYIAEYYVKKGEEVYVLNRNRHKQPDKVILIEADRHQLGNKLKNYDFDIVLDMTAYTKEDVKSLTAALGNIKDYVFLSSSAVYPETSVQPIAEIEQTGINKYWGKYGTNKEEAEKYLMECLPQAYIIRPPYLYGPMNNIYREAFVFDCALSGNPFYIPKDGDLRLQFFYIEDLCDFIDIVLQRHPRQHILNVGNKKAVTVKEWVKMCYQITGREAKIINVTNSYNQRDYFCFYDYEYYLDVSEQNHLILGTTTLEEGLKESYQWYKKYSHEVIRKPYLEFVEKNLK